MIEVFLSVFIPLIIIVNPASTLALFSVITGNYSKKERIKTAKSVVTNATILLLIFAFAGSGILSFLNIQIYSLRIAGGILLAFIGLDMTRRGQQFGESPPGVEQKKDYSLVPLAMPSLAGPGAITVTIVSMQTLELSWTIRIILAIIAIVLTMIITFFILLSSEIIIRILSKKGMDAFTRVMGLLTVAIAVQFALTGIASWIQTLNI